MNEDDCRRFADDALDRLNELNQKLQAAFKLGSYERWDYDQETGIFVFSRSGVPKVVAKVQVVGSIASGAGTWLWSWANASILEAARDQMDRVRAFGTEHGFDRLREAKWRGEKRTAGR